ncbi:MAG: hypothetical protein J0L52_06970 [Caulobacterales bacterium]|nr:hypothetical protein [Caulobacterales bacterium]
MVHDPRVACQCVDYDRSYAASAYYYSQFSTYRRPAYHPRPYTVRPAYPPPPVYAPPPPPPQYYSGAPSYVVRGRPVYQPGPVGYVQGPTIYVDAPPVYVEPAQIYIERPEIVVRPSEVIVAPPQIHYQPCPEGETCYQDPAAPSGTPAQGN